MGTLFIGCLPLILVLKIRTYKMILTYLADFTSFKRVKKAMIESVKVI